MIQLANPPFAPIPAHQKRLYLKLRITLWLGLFGLGSAVLLSFLFPTLTTSFDFQNPKSSKNFIFDPRTPDGTPRTNGKVEASGTLLADTSVLGDFSDATIALRLEKDSETPGTVEVNIRRGYRAFFYPDGDPITDFPLSTVYRVRDTYYESRNGGVLYPFVSEAAYLSRYPAGSARLEADDFGCIESAECDGAAHVSDQFIGFRVGSLLSFADGVFVVTSETEIRPIGSAEIFLAMGYRFEDVLPVNEEDLGIYVRGRIFLLGAPHPDGTLFRDTDSGTLYVIDASKKRPLQNDRYATFLVSKQTPIEVSGKMSAKTAECVAIPGLLARALECTAALDQIESANGPDYAITLRDSDTTFELKTLSFSLDTRMNQENVLTLLSKVKQRLFARFGIGA